MQKEGKIWNLIELLAELSQTAGAAMGVLSFLRQLKPAADLVINNVAPEMAARMRRNQQITADGPADDVNYIRTLLQLDDVSEHPDRPMKANMDSFLTWLTAKDSVLAIIYVFVVGLGMDDDERLPFMKNLAEIMDSNNNGASVEAHKLRHEYLQSFEAFRRPKSALKKYLETHPDFTAKIFSIPGKIADSAKSVSEGIDQDLQDSGMKTTIESFSQGGWSLLEQRRAARAAKHSTGGAK